MNKSRALEVLKALQHKPGHANDIGARTNMPPCTARKHLVALHANNEAHIESWEQVGNGPPIRVYALGAGIDAPNPFKGNGTALVKKGERHFDNKAAREEAKKWADRAARGETVFAPLAALFGIAQQGEQA